MRAVLGRRKAEEGILMAAFKEDSSLETWTVDSHAGPGLRPARCTGSCYPKMRQRRRAASCQPRNCSNKNHLPTISSTVHVAKAEIAECIREGGDAEKG